MLSVIVPTLNAEAHLPRALAALVPGVLAGLVKEVIVADGGSNDGTAAIAEATGCVVTQAARGRAQQLAAGAAIARGAWLLFLHADTALAPDWVGETQAFVADPGNAERAAAFRFAFDDDGGAARAVQFWTRMRVGLFKLPYGDQGLLISRAFYDGLGGFADIALMEDVDIVRRIGRRRLSLFRSEAVTSADKYRRDGFQKRSWRNLSLLARYYLGTDPNVLAQRYD